MRRALVVIDVQESFRARPLWAAIDNPEIAKSVGILVEASRSTGDLVVWVLHTEPGTGGVFDPELGFVRLFDELVPVPGEPTIRKTSHNAFTTTNLQQILTERGVGEVIVCGIRTEQCVETTARVASDLGYQVILAIDACATNPIEDWRAPAGRTLEEILNDPRTLSAADVTARTAYALSGRFATVRTVEELTGS
jgi:nicotinamidase-related amidase